MNDGMENRNGTIRLEVMLVRVDQHYDSRQH